MQKITDMINESDPHIMGKLDNVTWVHYIPIPFLEDYNSTVPIKKGGRGYGWFTAEYTSCKNASITFLNVDNSNLYTEGNVCSIIERKFYSDYTHILHGI